MKLKNWWLGRVRALGSESYIRLTPNPGFRIVFRGQEIRWNRFYGYRFGRVR